MAQRRKIGILFNNDPNWTGGIYYILNLVSALNTLDDEDKVEISVFAYNIESFNLIKATGYPYLKFLSIYPTYSFSERLINKISRTLSGKNLIDKYRGDEVQLIFPYQYIQFPTLEKFKKLYWIPDFQELYLPHFFSSEYLQERSMHYKSLAKSEYPILFSSNDAMQDYKNYYQPQGSEQYIVNFAVTHPEYAHLDIEKIRSKFNLEGPYFFSPNQFWAHKNHQVVLEAVKILKEKDKKFMLAFSGKESDHRNPGYFENLKKYVEENKLQSYVKFLGFLDRDEQLQIMNHAIAVVQPSLFEGWSTVVEDAKAMNQYVILSSLKVHKEQMDYNVSFFDPKNAKELASVMEHVLDHERQKEKRDYKKQINKFGKDFLTVLQQVR